MADRSKLTFKVEDVGWEHFEAVDANKKKGKM
jgi:hypothetical protein